IILRDERAHVAPNRPLNKRRHPPYYVNFVLREILLMLLLLLLINKFVKMFRYFSFGVY
ncbi:hypothetical protein MTR67_050099, partial [Solanum verrucosum]